MADHVHPTPPKRARTRKATAANYAAARFDPDASAPRIINALGDCSAWLRKCNEEYRAIRLGLETLRNDSDGLLTIVETVGPEEITSLVQSVADISARHKALAEILMTVEARLLAALSRYAQQIGVEV